MELTRELAGEPTRDAGPAEPTKAMSLRAIVLGSVLAIAVNLITPFNDYVCENTFFVGSYLPLALILTIFLFVMVGNGLYRWLAPRRAFATGEMAIVILMLLVSCSIPSQGLLRGLFPTLTAPFDYGATDPIFWKGFLDARMPDWLYPVPSIERGLNSDEMRYYFGRVPEGVAIPYLAWAKPLLAWGVYLAGFFTALVSLAYLLRVQWGERERLPFPLAQLQLSLIEPPEPGRAMNALFRTKGFWIASVAVLLVHSLSALHQYDVRWPEIPRSYDFRTILSEEPWRYIPDTVRTAPIYFTFIGATFFMRTRTAFSIWSIYLATQFYAAIRGSTQDPVTDPEWADNHLGSCIAFGVGMAFIGRQFFGQALRAAVGLSTDRHVLDRGCVVAARWLVVGIAVMFGWMLVIGASWWVAAMSIVFVIMTHVITSRIVAETGIPYVRTTPSVIQVLTAMPTMLPASSISPRNLQIAGIFSMNGAFQTREGLLGLVQHGMRVADGAGAMPRRFGPLGLLIGWTLAISLIAATWSSVTCYYSYTTPISPRLNKSILNSDVARSHPNTYLVTPMKEQQSGNFAAKNYSPVAQATSGFAITAGLQLAAWRFASWPLLPIGYLMSGTLFMRSTWLSMIIGWAAKVILIRVGGPRMLDTAKPLFIGLIFGEGLAAAVWMATNLILAAEGFDYIPYSALPT